jgi:hypothetical protein
MLEGLPASAGIFDKAPQPVVLNAQGNRAEEFKQLVGESGAFDKIAKLGAADATPVAIGKIRIKFATQTSAANTKTSTTSSNWSSAYVDYKLLGVQPDAVQNMADNFYADLSKLLAGRGFTVLPQDQLMTNAEFASAVAQTKSPETSEALRSKDAAVTAFAKQTAQFSGMFDGRLGYVALSKALKNPLVLELDFTVDIADFKKGGHSGGGTILSSASIESKPILFVKSGFVRVYLGVDGMEGSRSVDFPFKEAAILNCEPFAKVEKKAATGTDNALMVLGALVGNASRSSSYEITPVENFTEVAGKCLQPFAEVVTNVLPRPKAAQ